MNAVVAVIVAILIYPGIAAGLVAAWVLTWTRDTARATFGSLRPPGLLDGVAQLRSAFGRDTLSPVGERSPLLLIAPVLAIAAPLAVLVLLPVPGNPLVAALGLTGDLAAEGALLLGMPLMRLLVGWAIPSPYTRLAADRGARLLAGAVLPMVLALMALAQQISTLQITTADAGTTTALPLFALLTRLLAAAAFACCLPVLARATALRDEDGSLDAVAGELTDVSGFDLVAFRIAEALQLVAVAAFFIAAFMLPLLVNTSAGIRIAVWPVVLLVIALALGFWEARRGAQPAPADNRPPLSWWFGFPLLLALFALVLAAWAARGA
jgi:formate hydrogenlyase subunit 4